MRTPQLATQIHSFKMSWKFKASKYKNTAPLDPKFDKQIRELSIGSYHSSGANMITI